MTGAEALNTAIYNEKLAADHYKAIAELAQKADNATVAEFFFEQSRRETGHYNSLFKFRESHSEYRSSGSVGEVVKWITGETFAAAHTQVDIDIDAALQSVEAAERNSESFYRKAADAIEDKEIKELFTKLAEQEAHHLYLAQKVRTKFEQTGTIDQTDYEDLGQG